MPRARKLTDQLRREVKASSMSRYRICKEIELSQSAMSRFMSGESGLSMRTIDKLAALLNLELVKRDAARPKPRR